MSTEGSINHDNNAIHWRGGDSTNNNSRWGGKFRHFEQNGWGGYCNTNHSGHGRGHKNGDKQKDCGGCQSDSNNNISQAWGADSNSNNNHLVTWGNDNSSNRKNYSASCGNSPKKITDSTARTLGNYPNWGKSEHSSNRWERMNRNDVIEKLTEEKNSLIKTHSKKLKEMQEK